MFQFCNSISRYRKPIRQRRSTKRYALSAATAAAAFAVLSGSRALAQSVNVWTGGGSPDGNWSNAANWDIAPDGNDELHFAGTTNLTSNNDTVLAGYRIFFDSGAGAFILTGNAFNLFDFGGAAPKIENSSTNLQTINFAVTMSGANSGSSEEINPVNGDLLFGSTVTLQDNTQLKIFGNNGKTVTFNGIVSGTGSSVSINQASNVVFNAANTYTGETFVNAGTLQFASGGTVASSFIRLGDTSGTAAATLSLTSATGGQTISTPINVRSGSSGVKTISSTNTSGTNTLSGSMFLDADATLTVSSGGALSLTGSTLDLKNQTMTVTGAGNTTISGVLQNSTGSGKLIMSGTGILSLNSADTYTGGTTINTGGTIKIGNATALGTGGGVVTVNSGGVLDLNGQTVTNKQVGIAGTGISAGGALVNSNTNTAASFTTQPIPISANSSFGGAGSLTLASVVSGAFTLTKVGAGVATLSNAANTFGSLSVNGGVLSFGADLNLGAAPTAATAAALTLNGGTLRYDGAAALTLNINRGISIGASGGTIEVPKLASSAGLSTSSGGAGTSFGGAGILTKTGAGRFTLNVTQTTFTGKYKILGGLINVPGDGRLGAIPSSVVADYFFMDGGGLRDNTVASAQVLNANRGITLGTGGGKLIMPGTGSLTYNGIITGTSGGNLTIDWQDAASTTSEGGASGGIVILGGANTYDGATLINGGTTLRLGASGVIPDTSTVNLTAAAAMFDLATNGFDETVKSIAGVGGTVAIGTKTLTLNNPTGESYSSVFTASAGGKIVKNGNGLLTLSGNSTGLAGEFVVNSGKIGYGGSGALGANATLGTITLNGGVLSNTGTGGRSVVSTVTVNLSGDFAVDDSLFGPNPGQILFNGPSTIKNSNRTITVSGTSTNLGLGGIIGEDAAGRGIIKDGTGTLALTAANTYSGDTTILAGQININTVGLLGNGAGTLKLSGGKLNITASGRTAAIPNPVSLTASSSVTTSSTAATVDLNFSSNSISGTGGTLTFRNEGADQSTDLFDPRLSGSGFDFSRPIVIDNGAVGTTRLSSFNTTGTTQTFSAIISGTGSYRRSASTGGTGGEAVFSGSNTYSGGTAVNDGILTANNATGSATGSGSVTVATIGTLNIGNGGAAGAVSGDITNNGAVRFNRSDASAYTGVISGTGAVTKTGAGVLTLPTGVTHTYSGVTNVIGGTLLLNGTLNSGGAAVTVGDGVNSNTGVLGGGGTINRAVNISLGGAVSPGSSVGELTTGDETWSGGGTYVWEIADATEGSSGNGVRWDHIQMSSLNITANSGNKFTVKVVGTPANFTPTDGSHTFRWTIASAPTQNAIAGFDALAFNVDSTAFVGFPDHGFHLEQNGGDLDLVFVPEPGSGMIVLGAAAIGLARRRRR